MSQSDIIFQQLAGSWSLQRTFKQGSMRGRAQFSALLNEENLLLYKETGVMTLDSTNLSYDFFKEYLYGYSTLSSEITIYFNETPKRIYHKLELFTDAQCESNHQCLKDTYHGYYDFRDIGQGYFKTLCQVKGPKKDYMIVSHFHKK